VVNNHTLICKAIDESNNESLTGSIIVTMKNILLTATFQDDWVCPERMTILRLLRIRTLNLNHGLGREILTAINK